MNDKRFELDMGFGIRDNLTGKRYSKRSDLVKLLNDVSDRADRNAELLDMDHVTLGHKIKRLETMNNSYLETILKLEKIMAKYEIDSLEKLDLMLFYQKKW